jgi:tRNA(fMet)-specific endonuclease VapC
VLFHLDTNAVSDLIRQDARVLARLAAINAADELRTCVVVRGEILFGIDRLAPGKNQNELRERASSIFAHVACQAIRPSADASYSRIKCALEKMGSVLGENDLWIAACALDFGAILVTRDRAFQQISGLAVEDWTH